MKNEGLDFNITRLGDGRISSSMSGVRFTKDESHVLFHTWIEKIEPCLKSGERPKSFEMAGPREKIYFDPSKLKCGIVTCGGLCPGLNDVIRAIVFSLFYHYGVESIFGFRYGYEGLSPKYRHTPIELTLNNVADIHKMGGTILGSSRGPQDVSDMVDTLERMNVGILFTLGGDGTLRGAHEIHKEIERRKLKIAVIGIPKTIDNDISFISKSFGFETAVGESRIAISSAHAEARGYRNGIGLVKLMGRESGFIAANATLANSDVNFCLVPECPFTLEALLVSLRERLEKRNHAVIVVAEGAGQNLMENTSERDLSGNIKFKDIGLFLKDKMVRHFKESDMEVNLKYIDPSYMIRSLPANPHDSVFCLLLGQNAVHAGMSGRTDMVVGYWNGQHTHVPIPLAISKTKRIDPDGRLWGSVLASTGQKRDMM